MVFCLLLFFFWLSDNSRRLFLSLFDRWMGYGGYDILL